MSNCSLCISINIAKDVASIFLTLVPHAAVPHVQYSAGEPATQECGNLRPSVVPEIVSPALVELTRHKAGPAAADRSVQDHYAAGGLEIEFRDLTFEGCR